MLYLLLLICGLRTSNQVFYAHTGEVLCCQCRTRTWHHNCVIVFSQHNISAAKISVIKSFYLVLILFSVQHNVVKNVESAIDTGDYHRASLSCLYPSPRFYNTNISCLYPSPRFYNTNISCLVYLSTYVFS